jgi:hypothetical protein
LNNSNVSKDSIPNNLPVNNNHNNYINDYNSVKYQKLKIKKKNNNSFRVNHIKNLYKDEK